MDVRTFPSARMSDDPCAPRLTFSENETSFSATHTYYACPVRGVYIGRGEFVDRRPRLVDPRNVVVRDDGAIVVAGRVVDTMPPELRTEYRLTSHVLLQLVGTPAYPRCIKEKPKHM